MLSDCLLPQQTASTLALVCAPKMHGAWQLQRATFAPVLRACMLYSSVAALLGNAGQSNYGAANASLDALSAWRRTRALAASSVQWGPWAQVGMAAEVEGVAAQLEAMGFGMIGLSEGMATMALALHVTTAPVVAMAVIRWSRVLAGLKVVPRPVDLTFRRAGAES